MSSAHLICSLLSFFFFQILACDIFGQKKKNLSTDFSDSLPLPLSLPPSFLPFSISLTFIFILMGFNKKIMLSLNPCKHVSFSVAKGNFGSGLLFLLWFSGHFKVRPHPVYLAMFFLVYSKCSAFQPPTIRYQSSSIDFMFSQPAVIILVYTCMTLWGGKDISLPILINLHFGMKQGYEGKCKANSIQLLFFGQQSPGALWYIDKAIQQLEYEDKAWGLKQTPSTGSELTLSTCTHIRLIFKPPDEAENIIYIQANLRCWIAWINAFAENMQGFHQLLVDNNLTFTDICSKWFFTTWRIGDLLYIFVETVK